MHAGYRCQGMTLTDGGQLVYACTVLAPGTAASCGCHIDSAAVADALLQPLLLWDMSSCFCYCTYCKCH